MIQIKSALFKRFLLSVDLQLQSQKEKNAVYPTRKNLSIG